MVQSLSRRALLRSALRTGSVVAATGFCTPRVRACEAFASTLRITHPWTRATREGATYTALCMVIDEVTEDDRLIGVRTMVASSAELAGSEAGTALDLPIPRGSHLTLVEAGLHVRLTGLTQQLRLGRSFPLQLEFARGGLVYATLNVDQLPLPPPA